MALPKPVNVLGKGFRLLTDDESTNLVCKGRLLKKVKAPSLHLFTDEDLTKMREGQPLFAWYCDQLIMVAYGNETMLNAWAVEEQSPESLPTIYQRIKLFFKSFKF